MRPDVEIFLSFQLSELEKERDPRQIMCKGIFFLQGDVSRIRCVHVSPDQKAESSCEERR